MLNLHFQLSTEMKVLIEGNLTQSFEILWSDHMEFMIGFAQSDLKTSLTLTEFENPVKCKNNFKSWFQ